jgi:hypothetical protein
LDYLKLPRPYVGQYWRNAMNLMVPLGKKMLIVLVMQGFRVSTVCPRNFYDDKVVCHFIHLP